MKRLKNTIVSFMLTAATALCFTFASPVFADDLYLTARASEITLQSKTVDDADKTDWFVDSSWYGTVSVDKNNTYNNSPFSIKVVNNSYGVTEVKKTYTVKPNTYYKASAMVKCSNIQVKSDAQNKNTGAFIGESFSYSNSEPSKAGKWKKIEYTFFSGDKKEYTISLKNGIWYGECKGTVWFDDIKLEKVETTDNWNVLTIFFKKAKGTGKLTNGQTVKIDSTIDNSTISYYKDVLNGLYDDLDSVSGGLMDVKNIDYRVSNLNLNKFVPYDYTDQWGCNIHCLRYDIDDAKVRKEIKKLIGKKTYQQIILIVPHSDTFGWWGLTGSDYNNINLSVIQTGFEYYMDDTGYPTNVFIHEMGHGLEWDTNSLRTTPIASLHASSSYGYNTDTEAGSYAWYKDYYRNKVKGGDGIDKRVYKKPSKKCTLISNDMTTGKGISK